MSSDSVSDSSVAVVTRRRLVCALILTAVLTSCGGETVREKTSADAADPSAMLAMCRAAVNFSPEYELLSVAPVTASEVSQQLVDHGARVPRAIDDLDDEEDMVVCTYRAQSEAMELRVAVDRLKNSVFLPSNEESVK